MSCNNASVPEKVLADSRIPIIIDPDANNKLDD